MSKPWWQSKTIIGALLLVLTAALQHLGWITGAQADMAFKLAEGLIVVGFRMAIGAQTAAVETAVTAP